MMNNPCWCVCPGEGLTRFLVSESLAVRFGQFEEPEVMQDRLQYRFVNGFVDVGDLPCRKAFWAQMAHRDVALSDCPPMTSIYFANGSQRVDFSGFIHIPTHVQRWAVTEIEVDEGGDYTFSLGTCGGVRIWVNGAQTVVFTPFQRNTEVHETVILPLRAGANRVVVHAEDLFERDAIFFFELLLTDSRAVRVRLPDQNNALIKWLDVFVTQLSYNMNVRDHTLQLVADRCPEAQILVNGHVTGMTNEEETDVRLACPSLLGADHPMTVSLPADLLPAHYAVRLDFTVDTVTVSRTFGVNILADDKAPPAAELVDRKKNALNFIADHGMNIAGKLLALMATGRHLKLAEQILNRTLSKLSLREDCSDFSMVAVLWIWANHRDTEIPDELWDRTRSTILGYRYWLDEPGNDAMWFWSENHVLCFHVSQYLAGQYFPDHLFICSERSGKAQQSLAKVRLNLWFDHVLTHGLVEWNSSAYFPIDYIGLFALYGLADDQDLRDKAKTVIDRLMLMSALHYLHGVAGGTMGRVYEKELMANEMTELAGFGQVAWGNGWHTRMCMAIPMFCLSDYVPPQQANYLANLSGEAWVEAWYTQGLDRSARVIAWKQPDVTLSSVIDHQTGCHGHQQHVMDIQFAGNPKARLWINHPGEDFPGGDGRPSYWAGNGVLPRVVQYQHSAMMLFDLTKPTSLKYTHLYLPAEVLDVAIAGRHWCVVASGKAYALIGCSLPLEWVTGGLTKGREIRAVGNRCAWFVSVFECDNVTDFAALLAKWEDHAIEISDDEKDWSAHFSAPDGQDFSVAWLGQSKVNDQPWQFPADAGVEPTIIGGGQDDKLA